MNSDTKIININGNDNILTIYISNSPNINTLSFPETEFNNIEIYSINDKITEFINYTINRGHHIIQKHDNCYDILYKGKQEKWRRYNTKSLNDIMNTIDCIKDYNVSKVYNDTFNINLIPNNSHYNGIVIIHKNIINNIHPVCNSYYTIYNINTFALTSIPFIFRTNHDNTQYTDSNGIITNIDNNTAKAFSYNINCIFEKSNLFNNKFQFNDINILSVCPIKY